MARRRLTDTSRRVSRLAILIVGGFLLGLAISGLVTSAQTSRTAPRVGDADYALMVADLFEHEKSVFNARERLLVVTKNPLDFAEASLERAAKEKPDARRDIESLRNLTQALRQAESEVNPNARAAGPGVIVLIALILASVALAAGAAWIWRAVETRGTRLAPRMATGGNAAPRIDALLANARLQLAGAFSFLGKRPSDSAVADLPNEVEPIEPAPSRPARAPRAPRAPTAPAAPVAPTWASQSFEVRYELGDEDFDQVHPIQDADGELIAACGLSATEPTGDRPGRFYGFTAWMQSYETRTDLSAIGLVTRAGQLARSAAIAEWERRGTIEEAVTVERGSQVELRTRGARARITIAEFDYAPPSPGSPGYFARLVVRYDVELLG